ncbi:hypothetical protein [Croceicoccus naphthovorans]|uniref:Uncharacterized protein n=1 Tax=Croceicoccus naphthovorans TaxID=1348774 RepID=A0A0G3XHD3_9SPHN|nr:hypothetical protein [Croceicoccus naphthovorans]AKM09798.1 hypothetical protein AB433_07085 [Croceicoccus naphthovorans]MBB3990643.1 hypothetical protein [Croceicoccus naphthovorans]
MTSVRPGAVARLLHPLLAFALLMISAQSAHGLALTDRPVVAGHTGLSALSVSAPDCILASVRAEVACRIVPLPSGPVPSTVGIFARTPLAAPVVRIVHAACPVLPTRHRLRPPLRAPPAC